MDGLSTGTALTLDSSGAGGGGRKPVFWLRPEFVPLHQFLERMPLALTFGLWGMFFLEGWTCHVLELRGADGSVAPLLGLRMDAAERRRAPLRARRGGPTGLSGAGGERSGQRKSIQ